MQMQTEGGLLFHGTPCIIRVVQEDSLNKYWFDMGTMVGVYTI